MEVSEHELLPLPNFIGTTLPQAQAPAPAALALFLSTADASTILDTQRQHQSLAYPQQRIFPHSHCSNASGDAVSQ